MENEIFMQNLHVGLMITFIGMIVVLAFLTLMIGVMKINEKIIAIYNKYFPEVIEEKKPAKKAIKNADEEIAIAIAIAKNAMLKGGK